jgi:hypothetical protein
VAQEPGTSKTPEHAVVFGLLFMSALYFFLKFNLSKYFKEWKIPRGHFPRHAIIPLQMAEILLYFV